MIDNFDDIIARSPKLLLMLPLSNNADDVSDDKDDFYDELLLLVL